MNTRLNAVEALALVPGWDPQACRIMELDGGRTNRVYHVRSNGRQCVLRIDTEVRDIVAPDRRCELQVMQLAAAAGIAPRILYTNAKAGVLVTEYLHGRVWQAADLESSDNLAALAQLLRRVHALPLCSSRIDLTMFAEKYAEYIRERDGQEGFASHCVRIVREYSPPASIACCHNDIVATNVIDSGSLNLIDWEYTCDNEPLYDLASVIGFHDLGREQQHTLLSAYADGAGNELEDRLAEQIRLFDAIQWLWLAMHQLASPRQEQARRLETLKRRIR